MNLIIDQGNTVTKVAVFKADVLVETFLYEVFDTNVCASLLSIRAIDKCAFSTVIDSSSEVLEYLRNKIPNFLFIDHKVGLPIKNNYRTPKTLGKDRLAAAVAANDIFPDKPVLVIDVGTAITYELVDGNANYMGGNISPGVSMRFKALNKFTDRLPLVDRFGELPALGYDTETAIRAGVIHGVVGEIKSYIMLLRGKYPELRVILTGGHTRYIESQLDIEVFVDINLVLKGLNRILNYNVEA